MSVNSSSSWSPTDYAANAAFVNAAANKSRPSLSGRPEARVNTRTPAGPHSIARHLVTMLTPAASQEKTGPPGDS